MGRGGKGKEGLEVASVSWVWGFVDDSGDYGERGVDGLCKGAVGGVESGSGVGGCVGCGGRVS